MSIFESLYGDLQYPLESPAIPGFRAAQIAAIHAVSAHLFSNPTHPAIVSMPTGSGKTLILITLSIVLRAKRVLVLTPSRLVREQIAEGFVTLDDLAKINAVPAVGRRPKVHSVRKRIHSASDWEQLREAEVVVATVSAISGKHVPLPAPDLFDLILVDEAHHSPAATWSRILDAHKQTRQVLFTATPFRRDERQLTGKIVFNYNLDKANADRVFGDINFEPVLVRSGENADVKIAKATESKFKLDAEVGLKHLVMVRVDSRKRGKAIFEIYNKHTRLRLEYVTGASSLKTVRGVIQKLKGGDLDGIVCVDMFGEGFNLPNLKIAAVHSPHKSLAITLQFIGRFARTTAKNIGAATFLAEPRASANEIDELYAEGASWQRIVANLSVGRITSEADNRIKIDSFESESAPELGDLHFGLLKPYYHVKVFRCDGCDLRRPPQFPERTKLAYEYHSDELNTAVFVTEEPCKPRWVMDERFRASKWELYIVYYDVSAKLLFICASDRSAESYKILSQNYSGDGARAISAKQVNYALTSINGARFFNVGMRKRSKLGLVESYRTLSGPRADHAVIESDGRLYDRGHCFGKGKRNGVEATLGVSSAGKIWSNQSTQVPDFVAWCQDLATRISRAGDWKTGSPMDTLEVGRELDVVPDGIVGGMWSLGVYENPRDVIDLSSGEVVGTMLDLDIEIVDSRQGELQFAVTGLENKWLARYAFDQRQLIQAYDDQQRLGIEYRGRNILLEDYLSDEPPILFTRGFESIEGIDLYEPPSSQSHFANDRVEAVDWSEKGVDIQREKQSSESGISIFEWLEKRLVESDAPFVFCDDAAGEIADYVTLRWVDSAPVFELYHCKKSGARKPGIRVDDFYEVAFQAAKCAVWAQQSRILDRLKYRYTKRPDRLIKGTMADVDTAFESVNRQRIQFHSIIVQPGLDKSKLPKSAVSELLATANTYILHSGMHPLSVISS